MFFVYYDESGDDGYPKYTSPIFVLTATYFDASKLNSLFDELRNFRRGLAKQFGLPVTLELHTKDFLQNKNPYRQYEISDTDRIAIVYHYANLIGKLDFKIINVVINKKAIHKNDYPVLDNALTYSIQRIENDMRRTSNDAQFFVFSDGGRIPKMARVSRRVQRFNFIPSMYKDSSYRDEVKRLVGDPMEMDSKGSYFVQVSDLVATVIYSYMLVQLGVGEIPNRTPLTNEDVVKLIGCVAPSLNMAATTTNKHGYGIVCYPK